MDSVPLNIYLLRINVCRAPCHYVIDGSTDFQLMFSFVASNERKARGNKQKTDRSSSNNGGRGRQRKHKSLSPEKRLASTLAQSMSSISKSFEKLDLIGHHRKRSRSNHEGPKKQRKRSEAAASNKEVTIGTYYNVPFFCLSVFYDRKAIYSFVVNNIFLLFSSQTRTFQVQYGGCQAI